MRMFGALLGALLALTVFAGVGNAQEPNRAAQAWRLLDYMAVDYGGAVSDGRIVSQSEYAEMVEFAGQVRSILSALPPHPAQASLMQEAERLEAAVNAKASPADVAAQARALGQHLLAAYPAPLAPARAPDLARGAALYHEQCAACHGALGRGDGPAAVGLDPPVIAFSDTERARERSVFALYQVITQGLEGTAMADFSHLSSEERWALAFYVGTLSSSDAEAARGAQIWANDEAARRALPNLEALAQTTPAALADTLGEEQAHALMAHLRRTPGAAAQQTEGPLSIARARIDESLAAYEAGDRRRALDLALSAYLDGFEPVEPALRARDAALLTRVETEMGALRAAITNGEDANVRARAAALRTLFSDVEERLAPRNADAFSTFLGAFLILLREGLEALLIVVAMIAFLRKAERADILPYVHGGWIAALAAGGLTWGVATYLVSISGASRELTEGFGSLIAAVVLVSVGIWMHGKSNAEAWQRYIREKVSHALSKSSAWFLFLLAFLVVYREVFETILFYAALWSQGAGAAMLAGVAAGAAVLAVIGWLLLRLSVRLPISQFFSWSSLLIAALAIILAGKGVAALQEAGLLGLRPLAGAPRLEWVGLYPTWEGIAAQLVTAAALVVGFMWASRSARPSAQARA